ncbi:hypothetical protein F5Y06DRAFT_187299 [Hypoxylon sp. FL0890]|nr:hypothetical protein F5Y06DRAFT_187299 [Hypoxylon sp. FL0890]
MSPAPTEASAITADSDSDWETISNLCPTVDSKFSLGSISNSPTAERIRLDPPVRVPSLLSFEFSSDHSDCLPRVDLFHFPRYPSGFRIGQNPKGLLQYLSTDPTSFNDLRSIPEDPQEMDISSVGACSGASSRLDGVATQHDQRVLPGGSANGPQATGDTQIMTNSMLRAYTTMRGPQGSTRDVYGHLAKYAKLREEPASGTPKDAEEDLPYDYLGHYAFNNVAFEIPKPRVGDTEYPAGFQWDDSDDEEGANPSGRISSDMFLAMATGAKRWDRPEIKDPQGLLKDAVRTRPEGPAVEKDRYPDYLDKAKVQIDPATGEEISPTYYVPRSPSMIWTPPGVTENAYVPKNFRDYYSRMAPDDATNHIDRHYGQGPHNAPPAQTNENYTRSEVQEVANMVHGEALGPQLIDFLSIQYHSIAQFEIQSSALEKEVLAQHERIAALQKELEQLKLWYIPALQQLRADRAERQARRDAEKKKIREERIKEHIANHVRDAQYRLDRARSAVTEMHQKYADNLAFITSLQQDMNDACLAVGMNSPQEVYDEVNAPESPHSALAAQARSEMPNYSPETGMAQISPSTVKQSGFMSYGDIQNGGPVGPSTQQPIHKPNIDNYVDNVLGSQMKNMTHGNEQQAVDTTLKRASPQRSNTQLYGDQKDAYGTSALYYGHDLGNVGPTFQSTDSKWSVTTGHGDKAGPSTQQHPTPTQTQSLGHRLRRSHRDVSDASAPRQSPSGDAKANDQGNGKEVAGDATGKATSSSQDTDTF